MSDHEELLEWLASVRNDPVAYVFGAFEWGQGELARYSGPDDWQLGLLESVRDGVVSVDAAIAEASGFCRPVQEATTSGHGVGKSALVSWLILWAMDTEVDCKGVVTANTETQLKTKTWAELAKWHRLAITASLFKLTATSRFSVDPEHERTWRVDMVPWSERTTEAFAGLHNHGKRILIVFDEASTIPDVIWEVTEGALTDQDTQIIWAVFGNPTKNSGRFRDCFPGGRFSHRWTSRTVDSRDVKISNKAQIQGWIDDYGLEDDFVRVRVLGKFPVRDVLSFIPAASVREAMERSPEGQESLPVLMGVDVARFGPDHSVLCLRQGRDAASRPFIRVKGYSTVQLAGLVFETAMRNNVRAILIDTGGVGGGVFDQVELMGLETYAVDFGSKASNSGNERYLNKRAEIWGAMKDWIAKGGCLPASPAEDEGSLFNQLISPEYSYSRDVSIQLESKKDIRRRLKISPDDADALALTFAEPWLDEALPIHRNPLDIPENNNYAERNPYTGVLQ